MGSIYGTREASRFPAVSGAVAGRQLQRDRLWRRAARGDQLVDGQLFEARHELGRPNDEGRALPLDEPFTREAPEDKRDRLARGADQFAEQAIPTCVEQDASVVPGERVERRHATERYDQPLL